MDAFWASDGVLGIRWGLGLRAPSAAPLGT